MTTPQQFNCVLCKETFISKDELQTHFRKHGDPKFNQGAKLKSKVQNVSSDEKQNEGAEMVSCDVCTEMFPTISKAITHKHKKHPEHDAKYFCPWCGKLFTMKHLYNKHLHSSHKELERQDDINFHCDMCNDDFYVASAMLYHNKFFHRQDTDLPIIGHSKKLKMVNQDILQIYYCSFCGDEYDNKVNLHKHTLDDHEDENQSPEDVLRCPLCEAIFYHLDAYEIHLTFHSTDDLYSETNELFEQITEYSLETVPPLTEKVENAEPQDAESAMNAIGLDKFLEMAMDPSMDSEKDGENPRKSKKHKKHKKSKKSAITLDEFLNMNKDVFGEGLDFQGVEEVPTKVIAKNLKQKKAGKTSLKMLKGTDLEKLKKQGIVVKMKPNKKTVNAVKVGCKIPNNNSQLPQQPISSIAPSQTKTSEEVLSKFLSQGNSQIKIVKKSSSETADKNSLEKPTLPSDAEYVRECQTPENVEVECDVPQSGYTSSETEAKEESITQTTSSNLKNEIRDISTNSSISKTDDNPQVPDGTTVPNEKSINSKTEISNDDDCDKGNDNTEIETKIKAMLSNLNQSIAKTSENNYSTADENKQSLSTSTNTSSKNSLDAIKHLSHLIVKSVLNSKMSPKSQDDSEENHANITDFEDQGDQNKDDDSFNDNETVEKLQPTETKETTKSFEVLKSLSKNIIVKPLSHSPKSENVKNIYPAKNMVSPVAEQNTTMKSMATNNSFDNMSPKQSPKLKEIDETSPIISEKLEKQNINVNLLKNLTNITAKPISKSIQGAVSENSSNNLPIVNKKNTTPCEVKKNEIDQEIEIFNIDDSDSDEAEKCNTNTQEVNIAKTVSIKQPPNESLEKLKSIKNITMKSVTQQKTIVNKSIVNRMPSLKESLHSNDQCSMSDFSDEDDQDMMMPANLSINQKLSLQSSNMSPNIQALKNLGKHITVKSRNSSPSVSIKSNKDLNFFQGSRGADDADSDNDSLPGKVKISEINDDNFSGDDMGDEKEMNRQCDTNLSVQSPEASNSDHDENFNEDTDGELDGVESNIQKSTLKRTLEMAQNTLHLKNLNKNLTIKSISKNNKDIQPSSSKNSSAVPITANRELSIKPYKQIKPEVVRDSSNGNSSNSTKIVRATNQAVNQNVVSNNQLNTVNKEVTVKTFQTKTVIQEITTTVTKTIKTVNQTVKQQAQSSSSTAQPVKYQRVQGMKPNPTGKNFQGVTVRQASPATGTRVRGLVPTRPPSAMNVRPSNQLVPVRPSFNPVRAVTPRMPVVRKAPNQSGPNAGKPIRMSPNVMTTSKRASEDNVGHFSCFKKPKESLIPVSDIPNFEGEQMSSTVQYTSQKNFSSATKTVKGNTVFSSTQMRSESSSCSQQLNKLNNLSGLKIVKTSQNKQTMHVEEKSVNASQRNTLEAIEKLQKQGLLIKKPRMDVNEDSNPSGDENDQYLTEEPDN